MAILSVLLESILEPTCATAQRREAIQDQWVVREQRDGVANARAQAMHAGARELQFHISPGSRLGGVRLHRGSPGSDNFRARDIDEDGSGVPWLSLRSDSVK